MHDFNFENENFKIPEEQIPSKDINLESKEKSQLTKEELKDNNNTSGTIKCAAGGKPST